MNGNETCAAPAAAHVFGQCRACSCSHHIVVSGQPLVPSRLSHLAVHGTINRTISRCWGDELWCSMMNSVRQGYDPSQLDYTSLTLSCLYANSIVQTKLEVNLYLALIERQREGLVHVVAICSTCLNTYEGNQNWFSLCWRILLLSSSSCNPFWWVSLWPIFDMVTGGAFNRTAVWMKFQTTDTAVPIT